MPLPPSDRINELFDRLREQCRIHREQISALEDRISQIDTELHLQRQLNEDLMTPGQIQSRICAGRNINAGIWDDRRIRNGYALATESHLRVLRVSSQSNDQNGMEIPATQFRVSLNDAVQMDSAVEEIASGNGDDELGDVAIAKDSLSDFNASELHGILSGHTTVNRLNCSEAVISSVSDSPLVANLESIGSSSMLLGARITPLSSPALTIGKAPVAQPVLRLPFLNANSDPSIAQIANAISAAAKETNSPIARTYAPRESDQFPAYLPLSDVTPQPIGLDTKVDITASLNKEELRKGHRALAAARRFGRWKRIFSDAE